MIERTVKVGDLVSFWEPDANPSSMSLDCFERRVKCIGVVVRTSGPLCSVMYNQRFYSRSVKDVILVSEKYSCLERED